MGDIKNDGCLLTVSGTAIDFGAFLTVTAGEQERYRSGKLGFALLLWDVEPQDEPTRMAYSILLYQYN